jgi:signal transduction histidine kinase
MSEMPVSVLLVDDDEDDFVLTRQLLREVDPVAFHMDWAPDFEDALSRLARGGYDVCLVDYRMGKHDGIDFIIQAHARGTSAPMILLTGQGDREIDVAAMNAGAADFLNKTQLTASLLERAIRYSIQQKKSEQQRIRLVMEQAARAEAETANRAKDEFLAVLSHELRTPLTAVLLNVASLEEEADLTDTDRESLRVIRRNVDLEARLIDDLLDLTRIARGKLELRREVVDMHEQIDYAAKVCCASDIERKGLTVQVRTEAGERYVWGDPARLQQLLWNLIRNAVKFTPDGGRIEISTTSSDTASILVEVRDSGIGIGPEALPRIFNAFEQGDRSITRKFGGLGLGLAICKAITELHGGEISAHSAGAGNGAAFRIALPIVAHDSDRAWVPAGQSTHVASRESVSILLVEDHADTANAMTRLLSRRGYSVRAVTSVAEALRSAASNAFDVLISDIGLPDGTGLQLMRELTARGPVKGIALTGYGMEEDIERSRAAGFSEHLTKPINVEQLQAALDRITHDSASRKENVQA